MYVRVLCFIHAHTNTIYLHVNSLPVLMGFSIWFQEGIFHGEAKHMINLHAYDMAMALRKILTDFNLRF